MKLKNTTFFIVFLGIASGLYNIHTLVFYLFAINTASFQYSLAVLYLFFSGLSLVVLQIMLWIKEKNFDQVGLSFLLATSIKMAFCYLMVHPILQTPKTNNPHERINFFVLFVAFLTIETFFTIRWLTKSNK